MPVPDCPYVQAGVSVTVDHGLNPRPFCGHLMCVMALDTVTLTDEDSPNDTYTYTRCKCRANDEGHSRHTDPQTLHEDAACVGYSSFYASEYVSGELMYDYYRVTACDFSPEPLWPSPLPAQSDLGVYTSPSILGPWTLQPFTLNAASYALWHGTTTDILAVSQSLSGIGTRVVIEFAFGTGLLTSFGCWDPSDNPFSRIQVTPWRWSQYNQAGTRSVVYGTMVQGRAGASFGAGVLADGVLLEFKQTNALYAQIPWYASASGVIQHHTATEYTAPPENPEGDPIDPYPEDPTGPPWPAGHAWLGQWQAVPLGSFGHHWQTPFGC